jgi:hypothetical protein
LEAAAGAGERENLKRKKGREMRRISKEDLKAQVDRLNELTGSPMTPYTNGKHNAGNFHLSGAYGGWALDRICASGGSERIIGGYMSKRALLERLAAYISGIAAGEDRRKYRCFTRTWWRDNPDWPNGLEPGPGPKTTLKRDVVGVEAARAICLEYNDTHKPGRLSRKAEYEEQ